jgi:hypothetical protein
MSLRPADEHDEVFKLFSSLEPVVEQIPVPEYVVVYGCGYGLILRPDGSRVEYEDHVPGCEHQQAPKDEL